MLDPGRLKAAPQPSPGLSLTRAELASPEFGRFLYTAVGGDWYWIDRLPWTHAQWRERLADPRVETWVAYLCGTPVGYFELERQEGESVEIAYFGLLDGFAGQGIGGWLLTAAIQRGWQMGAGRVWVHTCSLDGPNALRNYLARGMQVF